VKKLLLLILLIVIAGPPIAWKLQGDRRLAVTIVDASVRTAKRSEHAGLVWLLEQTRIRKTGGRPYGLEDYFVYHPGAAEDVRRLDDEVLDKTELLYLADAQGVWRSGLEAFEMMRSSERDELIHSGFSASEIAAITRYIADGGRAVGEGLLFYARHGGENGRRRLEEAFGVKWTGWIGGWFKNLNNVNELPFWVRGLYERTAQRMWPYSGPGVLFIHPESGRFVVLTPGIELRSPRPELVINRRARALQEGVTGNVPLWGWFEVVEADDPEQIFASVRLDLTGAGENALDEARIPRSFPAVVAQWIDQDTYYLAADLSRVPTWLGPAQVRWMPEIRGRLAPYVEGQVAGEQAFWKFYIPFLRNLFEGRAY
jgi:hypothetical protein